MKSTEVRIGNLVLSDNKIVSVSGWYLYQKTIGENTNQYDKNLDWKPIPLTEELLKKFGFEHESEIEDFYHIQKLGTMRWLNKKLHHPSLGIIPTEYVHQLQNLYFALTGDELVLDVLAVTPNNTKTNCT